MIINRECQVSQIKTTNNAAPAAGAANSATGGGFAYGGFAGGVVTVPTGSSLTLLTWYKSDDNVTYTPLDAGGGSATTTTVAAGYCYSIPLALFGAKYIAVQGNVAGTLLVSLKS